jgi:phospholipid-binding lipoprotein MlaA
MNRKVFGFNETVDKAVMAPVARGYERVVPEPVRGGVRNFFANPRDLGSGVNLVLQGRPKEGLSDLARVATNTTVGLLGVFDVATPLGLPRQSADLGQTLGRWGVGSGAYVVLPLMGPSTVRDTANIPVDMMLTPQTFVSSGALGGSLTVLQFASKRADLLPATRLLDDVALDRYLLVRDTYLQRRQSLVLGEPQAGRMGEDSLAAPAASH